MCLLLFFYFNPSVHSFPSSPWSLCLFLFPPQRFIHPSEHHVLSIPFIGMIVIVAVVWCWLSELASQRARYGWSLSLSDTVRSSTVHRIKDQFTLLTTITILSQHIIVGLQIGGNIEFFFSLGLTNSSC